jgi:hypothetical protein
MRSEMAGSGPGDPKQAPLVYCIVLNLNGKALLLETLDSLRRVTYPNFRTVVVDNGSDDGSQDAVRSQFPDVTLIENGKNLGFGEGNNVGMRYAIAQGADWVFLLNNDIMVDPAMISEMIDVAATDPSIGILGPKIYYHTSPDLIWYAGGTINYWTGVIAHRGLRKKDHNQFDKVQDTDFVTGCAMLMKREMLDKIGLFDPIFYPIYSEDVDLSVRAAQAGWRIVYVPKAKLWHKVSAFSGGGMTPFKTRLKVEHNLIIFKRYAHWYHWLTIPFCIGILTIPFVVKELLKGNFGVITALLGGFVKAIKRLVS